MTKPKDNPRVRKHVLPTLRQKIKVYEKASEIITAHILGKRGICDCIMKAERELGYVRDVKNPPVKWHTQDISMCTPDDKDNHMQGNFPELYMYKPEGMWTGRYWWEVGDNGYAIRQQVLSQIIQNLKIVLSNQIRAEHVIRWNKEKVEKQKKEYRKSHPDFDFDL